MWDSFTIEEFDAVSPNTTQESDWYGPWDTVLHLLFPHEEGYQVSAQFLPNGLRFEGDYPMYWLIKKQSRPLAIINIKVEDDYNSKGTRALADNRIRGQLALLEDRTDLPRLYALSILGRRFGAWYLDISTGRQTPAPRPREVNLMTDTAPKEWWPYNILEADGEKAICQVATHIKKMACEVYPLKKLN